MLEDIAVVTGGTAIFEELGIKLENVELHQTRPGEEDSNRQGQHDDHRRRRRREGHQGPIASLKAEIENTTSDYDKEKLQERLAKLAGGVAQINVGAATEVGDEERRPASRTRCMPAAPAVEEGICRVAASPSFARARQGDWTTLSVRQGRTTSSLGVESIAGE